MPSNKPHRIERDSMGEVRVPKDALYGAQTQRAVENFTIDGPTMSRTFISALAAIKAASAEANASLKLIPRDMARAIVAASMEVREGRHDAHFPVVVYQTGSGTSSNMNANEVIATLATKRLKRKVHPNDHVNMGQSSNDVIPSAIHVSACVEAQLRLIPALKHLEKTIRKRASGLKGVVKTGRTHLMDAMPLTMAQEMGGWASQVRACIERTEDSLVRMSALALGGTAVGTGINAHKSFAPRAIKSLSKITGVKFREASDHFAAQGSMDAAAELSGQMKATASALMKIADDLRWMNSGPIAGIGEIALPSLQPGSSIMPGKVNPVISEPVMMAAARVMGNDVTVGVCNSRGNFQLNTMLPVIAYCLLESIELMAGAAAMLAEKAIAGFTVNRARIEGLLGKNPILVTALNPVVGYDKAAAIAKAAYKEGRPLIDVAHEMSGISKAELARILDPKKLT